MLANRFKDVLTQSTFILRSKIGDNILVAQEIFHDYHKVGDLLGVLLRFTLWKLMILWNEILFLLLWLLLLFCLQWLFRLRAAAFPQCSWLLWMMNLQVTLGASVALGQWNLVSSFSVSLAVWENWVNPPLLCGWSSYGVLWGWRICSGSLLFSMWF